MSVKKGGPVLWIYYDGACHLCSREIDHYRKIDSAKKLGYIDIADPSFDATNLGVEVGKLNKYFHIRTRQGEWKSGVDAFAEIWSHLPSFKWLAMLAGFYPTRRIMDIGYMSFAQVRPYLPKKKCHDGACEVR